MSNYLKACSVSFSQSTECLFPDLHCELLSEAVESQQLQWKGRWQLPIFSWWGPFMVINLTMVLGAFHHNFIPGC